MGTRGGNGGNWTPDGEGARDDLPELPPEWGEITIPDDPSELAEEAEQVRRELAGQPPIGWLRRPIGRADAEPSLGVPLLIMSVAVLITLISLFAMAWNGSRSLAPTTTTNVLPPISLGTSGGEAVPLSTLTPAVIILVEGCDCDDLVAATADAAPAGVTVVAVRRTPPPAAAAPDPTPANLRVLIDPDAELRTALELGPPSPVATVLLVDRTGLIVATIPTARTLAAYRTGLAELAA